MRAALLILAKDLRQRLRDRSALLVAIVVPLVLASIFGLDLPQRDRRRSSRSSSASSTRTTARRRTRSSAGRSARSSARA